MITLKAAFAIIVVFLLVGACEAGPKQNNY